MRYALLTAAAVLTLATGPALSQSVESYDDSWYRASYWSGEYPNGFSVAKTTTIQLRPSLDPKAAKTIACELPQLVFGKPGEDDERVVVRRAGLQD